MSTAARQHLAPACRRLLPALAIGAWLGRAEYLLQPSHPHLRRRATPTSTPGCRWRCCSSVVASSAPRWPSCRRFDATQLAAAGRGRPVYRRCLRRRDLQHGAAALRGRAERAGARNAVHSAQHRGDAARLRHSTRSQNDSIGRRAADPRRHRTERLTLENVRLWDHQPLLDTFGQLQVIRTYYDFVSVDNDRYQVNGTLRQVMLSARELNLAVAAEPHVDQRAPHLSRTVTA